MSVAQPYLSPAATPDNMMASPAGPQAVQQPAAGSQEQLRADIERMLLKVSQDLYELEVCAGDVAQGQEDRVPMYMEQVDKGLVQLSEMAARMEDTVPRSVVDYIDQSRNPHVYTKTTISRATGENQYALGRVLGLESFRRQLEESIGSEFPTIPLPPRRHQPIKAEINGYQNGNGNEHDYGNQVAAGKNGQIKGEEMDNGSAGRADGLNGIEANGVAQR